MLVLRDVTWDEYERFLEETLDHPGLRVAYDEGRLEVMSPSVEHEEYKDFVLRLVLALADTRGIPIETRGSATWRRRSLRKGAEPDCCFYVANAARIIGKRTIDLESDPPPDIVVEIDIAHESLNKFSIHAALGVPEIWRYDGTTVQFYERAGDTYHAVEASRCLPGSTTEMVGEALELSKTRGQTAALTAFRLRMKG